MPTKNTDTGSPDSALARPGIARASVGCRRHTSLGLVAFQGSEVREQTHLLQDQNCSRANNGLSDRCQLQGLDVVPECRGAYLNGQIKEVQVPGRTRNDILVHDRHADRGEAVGQNSSTRIVLKLGENATHAAIDVNPMMGRRLQQKALRLTELLLIHPPHLEILVLLVRHFGFVMGSQGPKRKARGWLSHRMTGIRKKPCSLREAARYVREGRSTSRETEATIETAGL